MIERDSSSKTCSSAAGGSPSHSAWSVSQGFGGLETGRGIPAEYRVPPRTEASMPKTLFRALAPLLLAAGTALAAMHEPIPSPTPDHHERKPDDVFRLQPLRGDV